MADYSDPDLGWPVPSKGAFIESPSGGGLLGGGSSNGGWLGNLFNFSGGRSTTADLYGDLFTKKQLAAIQQRESQAKMAGLLGAINQFAAPSKFKKNWGQLLGTAGQAMLGAEGGDKAATTALGGQLTAQKIAQMRQEAALKRRFLEEQGPLAALIEQYMGGRPAAGAAPPPGPPPGAPTQPSPGPAPHAPPPNPAGLAPPGFAFGTGAPRPFMSPGAPGSPLAGPPGAPPPPGTQQTGLLGSPDAMQLAGLPGGGPQLPFPEEGLPPPDTVIPSPGGAGLLNPGAMLLASAGGGSGEDWLNRNAPFPTRGDPRGDPARWRYDAPPTPSPEDVNENWLPGAVGVSAERQTPFTDPRTADQIPPPGRYGAPPSQPAGLTGSQWEIANHNYGGLRKPGVTASPSQGGFQSFATPEAGLAAISRQLDRYASGATTGKPLTTIRDIVSTWAPPSENPTATLIARAAKIVGVDPDQPLDLSDPQVKARMIKATIANEQGGRVPVDPNLIAQVANAPPGSLPGPDELIGQRPGVPGFTRAQYGGAPSAGGGGPAPAGNAPNMQGLLLELARRNASAEVLGMGTPYGSLLGVLQGSPAYKAEIETATRGAGLPFIPKETTARKEAEEPFEQRAKVLDLMIDMRKNGIIYNPQDGSMHSDPQYDAITGRRAEDTEALKLKYQQQMKDYEEKIGIAKEGREQKPATIVGPEGRMIDTTMPQSEIDRRRREQSMRPGQYRPGDIVDKPTAGLSADMEYRVTPQGTFEPQPIPNTPAARKEAEAIEAKRVADAAKQTSADFIVQDIDEIRRKVFENPNTTTGVVGGVLSKVDETAAGEIRNLVEGIEAGVLIDRLGALKAASSTGASGFGGLTGPEGDKLTKAWGSLKQTQGTAQFMRALDRYERVYLEILHGPVVAQKVIAEKAAARKDAATSPTGAPAVGSVRDGYRFKGGNPAEPASWEKAP